MRGSFWKTVAVVGVIGIGTLAVLEVRNRLPQQSGAQNSAGADAQTAAEELVAGHETEIDAPLQESEFDRLMATAASANESPARARFELTEPPDETLAMEDAPPFYGSDPVDPQPNTPPVDTTVNMEALAGGGNPFADMTGAETITAETTDGGAIAANYQGTPNGPVQPTGFAQSNSFAEDGPSAETTTPRAAAPAPEAPNLQPFRRDPDLQATPEPSEQQPADERPFSLFGADQEATPPPSENREAAATSSAGMRFFGASEETATSAPGDSTAEPEKSAQFYEPDAPALQPIPEPASGAPFEAPFGAPFDADEPVIDDQPVPAAADPQPVPVNNEFPAFDAEPENAAPFREDPVPTPRNPTSSPDIGGFDREFPGTADPPARQPAAADPPSPRPAPVTEDSSLPFVEDIAPSDTTGRSRIPELREEPSLSIPRPDSRFDPRTAPPETNSPAPTPDRDFDAIEVRPFPSGRQPLPSRDFSSPMPPPATGVREFGNTERDPRSDINQPDPGAINSNRPGRDPGSAVREFDSGPSKIIRPNLRSDDLRSGVRQVSGVMRPNLVLQKTAPENATVGTPLDYTINVRNEGDATAYEVVVEDEVPAGATVDGARPQPELNRTSQKLIWKFDQMDPGEVQEITVRITPTGEGTLDGVATVRFKSRVRAATVITAPKLRLRMAGPDEVRLGEQVTYRYVITNEGSGEARDLFVRTVLPASGGLKHPAGNDLEYEIPSLKPNEQREIVLSVVAAEPGEYRAEAEVTAAGGAKDQAVWRTSIVGAQLQIVRRGPKRRFVGRSATYENIISNETNFDADDARVVEQVPEGMKFLGANLGGRYDEVKRTVTWQLNRIGAGQQETLQVELMPTAAGSRESVVQIFENAGMHGDDHVSTTVVEDLHNVSADISQLDGPVPLGETFGFSITVDNRGTADATDIELSVDVPPEIQVVGAGSREVQARLLEGNIVQYNMIVRIPPDQEQSFELKLKGVRPVRNGAVEASIRYAQMEKPLVVSESVTIYEDR